MPLSAGTRLGAYEILSPLGAGGMGEVYRAHDTRLDRDVAIKVLPADVAEDTDRLRRFEAEARAAAALNHPNILALYDIGCDAGVTYIVTELLDGRTLREVLDAETLAVSRVLDLAAQIADGLAAAHSRNIVHRDLKPHNIFVTSDGRAKILDFGLAKKIESAASAVEAPTRSGTAPHTVLGTAGYMAPEQVRQQAVDHRTDIFVFGAVLYEMLTGHRAFASDTMLDTMSAILREAPSPILPTPGRPLPPSLVRIVDRCLEKSPASRYQSATDLAFALRDLSHGDSATTTSSVASGDALVRPSMRPTLWHRAFPWAVAALGVIAAALAWLPVRQAEDAAAMPVVTFEIAPPDGEAFDTQPVAPHPAISPDGQQLAFQAGRSVSAGRLWLRSLRGVDARPLGASGAQLFWEPHGRSIGFLGDGKLQRIDLDTGMVHTICELPGMAGAAWSPEGIIVVGGDRDRAGQGRGPLLSVPERGGTLTPVTVVDDATKQISHRNPFFLPGGRRFLYQTAPDNGIWVGSLDGAPPTRLLTADSKAQYAAPGWLLFVRQNTLFAQRFDADRLALVGDPRPLAEDVRTNENNGRSAFTVASNGILVYRTGDQNLYQTLAWVDRSNKEVRTVNESAGRYDSFRFFPDEREIVAALAEDFPGHEDLWRIDLDSGRRTKLTTDSNSDRHPVVSPDGRWVAWWSSRTKPGQVFKKSSSGAGRDEPWIRLDGDAVPTHWSDHWLILQRGEGANRDIWYAPVDGSADPREYLATEADETFGALSPDEKWMAYQSNEGGRIGVYVRPFPDALADRQQVSGVEGGGRPEWRRDSQEIFYRTAMSRQLVVMAVSVTPAAKELKFGTPRVMWQRPGPGNPGFAAITRDGQRALLSQPPPPTNTETPLTVIVNWTRLVGEK
jgi:eukaryotic-like serine/threonine-protein kinase